MPDALQRKEFLQTVWYESRRAGLDTGLVLGVIDSASGFRQFYASAKDARGYMGVNAKWSETIGDGDRKKLFHVQTNLRFGCVLLRHFIDKNKGDIYLALGEYAVANSDAGKAASSGKFQNAVLVNARRWDLTTETAGQSAVHQTRSGPNKQGVDRLNEVISGCVRTVHEAAPADYTSTFWSGFDAFYNPASGRVEDNAILVGQLPARFAFNKCMAQNGIPLTR